MDPRRFDRLARALAAATTRRAALAALAAALAAGSAADVSARRRRRCRPACPSGQTCIAGACACDDGGAVCGVSCCTAGQECRDGACIDPAPACIPFGAACKNAGRPCCEGLACGSGQAGQDDVACYVPAGGPCAETAACVYGAECRNGTCEAILPPPPCLPAGPDALANGAALQAAIDAAAPGATISLSTGTYDGDFLIRRAVSLVACPGAGEVTLRNATVSVATVRIVAGPVRLEGLTLTRGSDSQQNGGGLVVATPEALNLARRLLREHATLEAAITASVAVARRRLMARGGRAFTPGLDVTLVDCAIVGNSAAIDPNPGALLCPVGGGIFLADGRLTLDGATTVSGNSATGGGGIYLGSGELVLAGSTRIDGNRAMFGSGGGVYATLGSVSIGPGARITGNSSTGAGGGMYLNAGVALTPPASSLGGVVFGNTADGGNCAGIFIDDGFATCYP